MEADDLKIFNALNAAMAYFKEGCEKRELSIDSKDWSLPEDSGQWGVTVFDYRRARLVKPFDLSLKKCMSINLNLIERGIEF